MTTMEERFWAKVDKTDECWQWKPGGYPYGSFSRGGRNTTVRAHVIAYELAVGPVPDGMMLDYKCHNKLCVRVDPDHVRLVTAKGNQENRVGATKRTKSGFRGVTWHKASGRWRGDVGHHGKTVFVGYFDDPVQADEAVRAKREELYA